MKLPNDAVLYSKCVNIIPFIYTHSLKYIKTQRITYKYHIVGLKALTGRDQGFGPSATFLNEVQIFIINVYIIDILS